jgi:hypothetical protein
MCGAASNPIFTADLFDPSATGSNRWKIMAPASQLRLYHSGALLVGTGHVVTFGNEVCNCWLI